MHFEQPIESERCISFSHWWSPKSTNQKIFDVLQETTHSSFSDGLKLKITLMCGHPINPNKDEMLHHLTKNQSTIF